MKPSLSEVLVKSAATSPAVAVSGLLEADNGPTPKLDTVDDDDDGKKALDDLRGCGGDAGVDVRCILDASADDVCCGDEEEKATASWQSSNSRAAE